MTESHQILFRTVGLDKLVNHVIQNYNITLTDIYSQAAGKEIVFQILAGRKTNKNWVSSQTGTWGCTCECECVHVCEGVSPSFSPWDHAKPEPSFQMGLLHMGQTPL